MEKLLPQIEDPFIKKCPKRAREGLCTFGIPGQEPRPFESRDITIPENLNITDMTPLIVRICEAKLEYVCNGNPNNLFSIPDPIEFPISLIKPSYE